MLTKKLRVLMVNTSNSGVSHWRMQNFHVAALRTGAMDVQMPFWQKDSHDISPWQGDILDAELKRTYFGKLWACLREADVCVMQMVHFPSGLNTFMAIRDTYKHIGVPIVAECDDNYLSTPNYNPASGSYQPGSGYRELATKQFRAADALIVSTPHLKDVYAEFNDHIYVVENAIDQDFWNKGAAKRKNKPGIRIGWVGGASHVDDLKLIEPVVHRILAKHKDVTFVFVHGIPEFFKGHPRIECVQRFEPIMRYPGHVAKQDFDIGLAPLVDNDFNRSKSNIRWLEYSALGIPTVASNVGHFKETITHGQDGLLAETEADWEAHLDRLIADRKYRVGMGLRAKDTVFRFWNVDHKVQAYAKALAEIRERGQVAKDDRHILYGERAFADTEPEPLPAASTELLA